MQCWLQQHYVLYDEIKELCFTVSNC